MKLVYSMLIYIDLNDVSIFNLQFVVIMDLMINNPVINMGICYKQMVYPKYLIEKYSQVMHVFRFLFNLIL